MREKPFIVYMSQTMEVSKGVIHKPAGVPMATLIIRRTSLTQIALVAEASAFPAAFGFMCSAAVGDRSEPTPAQAELR